jgi:hypothetical protein
MFLLPLLGSLLKKAARKLSRLNSFGYYLFLWALKFDVSKN